MIICNIDCVAITTIASGLATLATTWMVCQTYSFNMNAKESNLDDKKGNL